MKLSSFFQFIAGLLLFASCSSGSDNNAQPSAPTSSYFVKVTRNGVVSTIDMAPYANINSVPTEGYQSIILAGQRADGSMIALNGRHHNLTSTGLYDSLVATTYVFIEKVNGVQTVYNLRKPAGSMVTWTTYSSINVSSVSATNIIGTAHLEFTDNSSAEVEFNVKPL